MKPGEVKGAGGSESVRGGGKESSRVKQEKTESRRGGDVSEELAGATDLQKRMWSFEDDIARIGDITDHGDKFREAVFKGLKEALDTVDAITGDKNVLNIFNQQLLKGDKKRSIIDMLKEFTGIVEDFEKMSDELSLPKLTEIHEKLMNVAGDMKDSLGQISDEKTRNYIEEEMGEIRDIADIIGDKIDAMRKEAMYARMGDAEDVMIGVGAVIVPETVGNVMDALGKNLKRIGGIVDNYSRHAKKAEDKIDEYFNKVQESYIGDSEKHAKIETAFNKLIADQKNFRESVFKVIEGGLGELGKVKPQMAEKVLKQTLRGDQQKNVGKILTDLSGIIEEFERSSVEKLTIANLSDISSKIKSLGNDMTNISKGIEDPKVKGFVEDQLTRMKIMTGNFDGVIKSLGKDMNKTIEEGIEELMPSKVTVLQEYLKAAVGTLFAMTLFATGMLAIYLGYTAITNSLLLAVISPNEATVRLMALGVGAGVATTGGVLSFFGVRSVGRWLDHMFDMPGEYLEMTAMLEELEEMLQEGPEV